MLMIFLYELLLIPLIYVRIVQNIIKVATVLDAIGKVCIWLFIGPFFLLFTLVIDLYYYCKILCDYKEDDDAA